MARPTSRDANHKPAIGERLAPPTRGRAAMRRLASVDPADAHLAEARLHLRAARKWLLAAAAFTILAAVAATISARLVPVALFGALYCFIHLDGHIISSHADAGRARKQMRAR